MPRSCENLTTARANETKLMKNIFSLSNVKCARIGVRIGVGNSVRPGVRTGGRWIKYFDGDIQQQQVIMDGPAQQRLTGVGMAEYGEQ